MGVNTKTLMIAVGVILSLVFIGSLVSKNLGVSNTSTQPHAETGAEKLDDILPPGGLWSYSDDIDPMTSGHTRVACVNSINKVTQAAPYEDTVAQLCIRRTRRSGLNVFVRLMADGQVLCDLGDGCSVPVRFEARPVRRWSAVGAADGTTNMIFLEREKTLVGEIKSARSITIEIELYQNGDQALIFPTYGLKWP